MAHTAESRERAWQKIKKRKDDWFAENGPCAECGSSDRLELDHIEPEDKVSHRVWSWAEERLLAELAKCQVLCYDCHKKKTIRQRDEAIQHGSVTMYKKYRCRCELCREAKRAENRRLRGRP